MSATSTGRGRSWSIRSASPSVQRRPPRRAGFGYGLIDGRRVGKGGSPHDHLHDGPRQPPAARPAADGLRPPPRRPAHPGRATAHPRPPDVVGGRLGGGGGGGRRRADGELGECGGAPLGLRGGARGARMSISLLRGDLGPRSARRSARVRSTFIRSMCDQSMCNQSIRPARPAMRRRLRSAWATHCWICAACVLAAPRVVHAKRERERGRARRTRIERSSKRRRDRI